MPQQQHQQEHVLNLPVQISNITSIRSIMSSPAKILLSSHSTVVASTLHRHDHILREADFASVLSCPWKSPNALIDFIDNVIKPHPNRSTLLTSLSFIHVLVANLDSDREVLAMRQREGKNIIANHDSSSPSRSCGGSSSSSSSSSGGRSGTSHYNKTWKEVLPKVMYDKLRQYGQLVIGWMLVDEHSVIRPSTEEGCAIFNPCGICLIDFIDTELRGHNLAQYMIERFEKTNITLLPQEITKHAAEYWYHSTQLASILDSDDSGDIDEDGGDDTTTVSVLSSLERLHDRLRKLGLDPHCFAWETLVYYYNYERKIVISDDEEECCSEQKGKKKRSLLNQYVDEDKENNNVNSSKSKNCLSSPRSVSKPLTPCKKRPKRQ